MLPRFLKRAVLALAADLVSRAAYAQGAQSDNRSIFSNPGQGGRWIEEFFPYGKTNLEGVHAAVGKMLQVYNTGILVLATVLVLWAIVSFVVESAQSGEVGGRRRTSIFTPLRLVLAIALLVPVASGYNGAQIVALKLGEAGSGLANSIWKKFSPASTSLNFSRSAFAAGNVDAFLQQALIDEACFAATQLNAPSGSIKVQAFYAGADGKDREGEEIPLSGSGGMDAMSSYGAIATESRMVGQPARSLRIHYNRAGNDDYCGSLDLPVPAVPQHAQLEPEDQTAYAAAYLHIRPDLAGYAQRLAVAIDAAVKAHANVKQPNATAPEEPPSQAYLPPENPMPPPSFTAPAPTPLAQTEVPHIELPVASWDALIDKFNATLLAATDRLQGHYITAEIEHDYSESSDEDWLWAGSLFFKLSKLSLDDLRLRYGIVSASLPNAQILPAEMRSDGMLAGCPDIRNDIFLPDYNCRPEGRETTLVIKTAQDIVRTVESQRADNGVQAIDAGPGANHRNDVLSGNLIAAGRLDAVVAALAHSAQSSSADKQTEEGPPDEHFESMFDAVNIGNALYLSSSSLFRASALTGSAGSNNTASTVLSLFAVLVLVPAFFLAIYLPLLPALRFFLGAATWLVTIVEALVALPLIALVQLRTEGDGVMAHGRQGWFLLLQMLLRPALMIFGLMAGIVIFDALYSFITWAIWSGLLHVTSDTGQFGAGIEGMLELLGYLFFWALLVYLAANLSFNAITAIPDRILVWIGAADVGSSVRVTTSPGSGTLGSPNPAFFAGPQGPILPSAPASALVTGDTLVQQIGQFGGPAGTYAGGNQSGAMANGGDSANFEQFPMTPETHPADFTGSSTATNTTTVITGAGGTGEPRIISGRPKAPPRQETDYVPPVHGGEK